MWAHPSSQKGTTFPQSIWSMPGLRVQTLRNRVSLPICIKSPCPWLGSLSATTTQTNKTTQKNCIKQHLESQKPAFITLEMSVWRWTTCLKMTHTFLVQCSLYQLVNKALMPCHCLPICFNPLIQQSVVLAPPIHASPLTGALQLSQIITYRKKKKN